MLALGRYFVGIGRFLNGDGKLLVGPGSSEGLVMMNRLLSRIVKFWERQDSILCVLGSAEGRHDWRR